MIFSSLFEWDVNIFVTMKEFLKSRKNLKCGDVFSVKTGLPVTIHIFITFVANFESIRITLLSKLSSLSLWCLFWWDRGYIRWFISPFSSYRRHKWITSILPLKLTFLSFSHSDLNFVINWCVTLDKQ